MDLAQHIHCTHIIFSSSFSCEVHVCIYPKWTCSVALYHPRAYSIFVVKSMWFHTQLDSGLGTLDALLPQRNWHYSSNEIRTVATLSFFSTRALSGVGVKCVYVREGKGPL